MTKSKAKTPERKTGPRIGEVKPNYGDHEWAVRSLIHYTPKMGAKEATLDSISPFTTKEGAVTCYTRAVEQAKNQVKVVTCVELLRREKGKWVAKESWKRK